MSALTLNAHGFGIIRENTVGATGITFTVTGSSTGITSNSFVVSDDRFEVVADGNQWVLEAKVGLALNYEAAPALGVNVSLIDNAGNTISTADVIVRINNTGAYHSNATGHAVWGLDVGDLDTDGNDFLHGWGGNDRLHGRSGDDILFGGSGDNIFFGGSGADIYVLNTNVSGTDTITYFRDSRYNGDVNDKIRVYVDDKTGIDTLEELYNTANLRVEKGHINVEGLNSRRDSITTENTAIYKDNVLVMVVEDFEADLTFDMFEVVEGKYLDSVTPPAEAPPNQAPTFAQDSYSATIAQGAEVGDIITNIAATDAEGDTLTYSITAGNDAGLFIVDATNGDIKLAVPEMRTNATDHTLTITATDAAGNSDTATVTITDYAIRGTDAQDALHGTTDGDTIYGYGGSDTITGGDGSDVLWGGSGVDIIYGGGATDVLSGGEGDDIIYGGDGDDVIYGNEGDDTIYGGAGRDLIKGQGGADSFVLNTDATSSADMDVIGGFSVASGDKIRVESFNGVMPKTIEAFLAAANLRAETGEFDNFGTNNTIIYKVVGGDNGESDDIALMALVYFSEDLTLDMFDLPNATANQAPTFAQDSYTATIAQGAEAGDIITNIAATDADDDTLTYAITAGNDAGLFIVDATNGDIKLAVPDTRTDAGDHTLTITATDTAGNSDTATVTITDYAMRGTDVQDVLHGTIDGDAIYGYGGNDYLNGGDGDDTIYGGDGIDRLRGNDGDDTLYGGSGSNSLTGGDGDDTLYGGSDRDSLSGGYGNDVLYGGSGNDKLFDLRGIDLLHGGLGADLFKMSFFFDTPDDVTNIVVDFNAEEGDIIGLHGIRVSGTFQPSSVEELAAAAGLRFDTSGSKVIKGHESGENDADINDTVIYKGDTAIAVIEDFTGLTLDMLNLGVAGSDDDNIIHGGDNDDTIDGNGGNDTLYGGDGHDKLYGNAGDDTIYGGDGKDAIFGSAGDDIIHGGDGNDSLIGGVGADTIYGGAGIVDHIYGNDGDDILYGGDGDDFLNGQGGADIFALNADDTGADLVRDFIPSDGDKIRVDAFTGAIPESVEALLAATNLRVEKGHITLPNPRADSHSDSKTTENTAIYSGDKLVMVLEDFEDDLTLDMFDLPNAVANNAPTFAQDSYSASIARGAEAGDIITNIAATDAGDTLTYSITAGNDAGLFIVDATNGDIKLATPETKTDAGDHTITITATDTAGNADSATVTITDYAMRGTDGDESIGGWDSLVATGSDIIVYGNAGDDIIGGTYGDDTLYGGDGDDFFRDRSGDDKVYGGAGEDVFYSGRGSDLLYGGADKDVFMVVDWGTSDWADGWTDIVVDFSAEDGDNIHISGGFRVSGSFHASSLDALSSAFDLRFDTSGNKIIEGHETGENDADIHDTAIYRVEGVADDVAGRPSNDADDTLIVVLEDFTDLTVDMIGLRLNGGYSYNDPGVVMHGAGAYDILSGSYNDDILNGGGGNDSIFSWGGDDIFIGGAGIDSLSGGGGADIYVLNLDATSSADGDVVITFGSNDKIRVEEFDDEMPESVESFLDALNLRVEKGHIRPPVDLRSVFHDSATIENTAIYKVVGVADDATNRPSDDADDVFLMLLEDFTADLTLDMFDLPNAITSSAPTFAQDSYSASIARGAEIGDIITNIAATDADSDTLTYAITAGNDSGLFIVDITNGDIKLAVPDKRTGAGDRRLTIAATDTAGNTADATVTITDYAVRGTDGNDTFHGRDGADFIYGYGGNDHLYGIDGDDTLYGGAGNDYLEGMDGDDTLSGGAGDDDLDGMDGDDTLYGGDGDDYLFGENGDDTLSGGAGDDYLYGDFYKGAGDDILDGGSGDDDLWGGAGDDILDGGSGDDDLWGGAGDDILDGGAGDDDLWGGAGDDILDGGAGDDDLWGGAGDDILDGGAGNDDLWGGGGDDILDGGAGNDDVRGGNDDGTLYGGAGNDRLNGEGGDDTLYGGDGKDYLRGGDDADIFVLGSENDTVVDFTPSDGDKIRIADFTGAKPATIEAFLTAANLRVEKGHIKVEGFNSGRDSTATENTAIYRGDTLLMVLEDFTDDLTLDMFDLPNATANNAPTFAQDSYSATLAETAEAGSAVVAVQASDVDAGDTLTYSITDGDGLFAINEDGEITLTGALDYETATTHTFTIQVEDEAGLTDTAEVTINVENANEAPIFSQDSYILELRENVGVLFVNSPWALDVDAGDVLTYSIIDGNEDGQFAIHTYALPTINEDFDVVLSDNTITLPLDTLDFDNIRGYGIALTSTLDYETATSHTFTIQVEDEAGLTDTAEVTINVENANEAPEFAQESYTAHIQFRDDVVQFGASGTAVVVSATDADGDALTYAITAGNDAGLFDIDGEGNITFGAPDVRTNPATHTLTVTATDTAGNFDTATVTITDGAIRGTDGGEAITGGESNDLIYSNDGDDILHGNDGIDTLDGGAGDDTLYGGSGRDWLYGREGDDILHGNDGNDVLLGEVGDDMLYGGSGDDLVMGYNGDDTLYGGAGADRLVGMHGADIFVLGSDVDRVIDFTPSAGDKIRVAEFTGAIPGSIDAFLTAANLRVEKGDINVPSNGFDRDNDDADIENTAIYQGDTLLMVLEDFTDDLTLDMFDLPNATANSAPTFAQDSYTASLAENAEAGSAVIAVQATDANAGDTLTYSIVSNNIPGLFVEDTIIDNAPPFAIDANSGAITLTGALDFETATTHTFTIQVEDSAGLTDTATITINVTDSAIRGTDDDDRIGGTADADTIYGYGGDDFIYAHFGADTLYGGAGDDVLHGSGDNDTLYGGAGDDTLDGGAGLDTHYGGEGDDEFALDIHGLLQGHITDDSHADTLKDFGNGNDKIHIHVPASVLPSLDVTISSLEQLYSIFNLRVEKGHIAVDGLAGNIDDTAIENTAIYSGDVLLMVLEDFTADLTLNMFAMSHGIINRAPEFAQETYTATLAETAETGSAVVTVAASDADIDDTLTYSIIGGDGGGDGLFAINDDGEITLTSALDYETATSHNLTIKAQDKNGDTDTAKVVVHVTDANDNAPIFDKATHSVEIPELTEIGTTLTTVTARDADTSGVRYSIIGGRNANLFSINENTGAITLKGFLDFETAESHRLVVQASDGVSSDTINVIISVVDEMDCACLDIAANTEEITAGTVLTASITHDDPNGYEGGKAPESGWVWFYQSKPDQEIGDGSSTYTVREEDSGEQICVRITYMDGNGRPEIVQARLEEAVQRVVIKPDAADADKDKTYTAEADKATKVEAGTGADHVRDGNRNDVIDGGKGDDEIDLGASKTDRDEVIYGIGNQLASGGSDSIKGFVRGRDKFVFQLKQSDIDASGMALNKDDGFEGFVDYVTKTTEDLSDDQFWVNLKFGFDGGIVKLGGVSFHFQDSTFFSGGRISMPIVSIKFADSLEIPEVEAIFSDSTGPIVDRQGLLVDLDYLDDILGGDDAVGFDII